MRKGFTLVELILYLAIVSLIFSALVPFAWNIIEGGVQSGVDQEVTSNAWFVMEKIKTRVRNAESFTVPNATTLILNPGPVTISLVGTYLQLTEGGFTYNLNSADTSITGLTFKSLQSASTKQLQINLTVNSTFTQTRNEYKESVNLQSGVEVRSL